MKFFKKSLASLLSLALLLTCIPFSAAAAGTTDVSVRTDDDGNLEVTVDYIDTGAGDTLDDAIAEAIEQAKTGSSGSASAVAYDATYIAKLTINCSVTALDLTHLATFSSSPAALAAAAATTPITYGDLTNLAVLDLSGATLPAKSIPASQFSSATFLTALEEVVLPTTITTIGANAFVGATSLDTVNFSDLTDLATIGDNAFDGAALRAVDLSGSDIANIGTSAFANNVDLISVDLSNLSSSSLVMGDTVFDGSDSLIWVDLTYSPVPSFTSIATAAAGIFESTYAGNNTAMVVIESAELANYQLDTDWTAMTASGTGSAEFTHVSAPKVKTATGTDDNTVTFTWDAPNYLDIPSSSTAYYQFGYDDGTGTVKWIDVDLEPLSTTSYTRDVQVVNIANDWANYDVETVWMRVAIRSSSGTYTYGPGATPNHELYQDQVIIVPLEAETVDFSNDLDASNTSYDQNVTASPIAPAVIIDEPNNISAGKVAAASGTGTTDVGKESYEQDDFGKVTYQWYYDKTGDCDPSLATVVSGASGTVDFTGGTSVTITAPIPDTTLTYGDYFYFVVITNENPMAYDATAQTSTTVSNYKKITIKDPNAAEAPIITLNPLDATYVLNESSEPLKAAATSPDGGSITYYWYYSETTLGASSWLSTGSTTDTYSTTTYGGPATNKYGTFYYYADVYNTNNYKSSPGKLSTAPATIIVTPEHPVITGPDNANYQIGDTVAALTATATVSDGGTLTYQWYSCDDASGTNPVAIPGAVTATYTPDATITDAAGEYFYYVDVKNTNKETVSSTTGTTGTYTGTSSVARVSVGGVDAETPVLDSVTDGAAITGSTGTVLTAPTYSGVSSTTANITYQWYSCDDTSKTNATPITGANGSTYEPDTTTAGTYYYYVEVINTDTAATGLQVITVESDVYTFTVTDAPVNAETPDLTGPADIDCDEDDAVSLSVSVAAFESPTAAATYQWYSCDDASGTDPQIITGADGDSYDPDTSVAGTYYYYVEVTNTDPSATSSTTATATSRVATVTVESTTILVNAEEPNIITQPVDTDYELDETSPAPLTVEAEVNSGTLYYQWFICDDATGTNPQIIDGATSASYTPDVSTEGTFYYAALIMNYDDTATGEQYAYASTDVVTVTVTDSSELVNAEAPEITKDLVNAAYEVDAEDPAALEVEATVTSGTLSYQWYICDDAEGTNARPITGATDASYTPDVSTAGTYYYYVEVTNTDPTATGETTATTRSSIITVNVATEFTVTFMNGDETFATEIVAVNDKVAKPAKDPVKEGYDFTGWYTDEECTEEYDFDAPVISDLTLYAGWEEEEVTTHKAYVAGYDDGTFRPNASITRAEAAQMFYNLLGYPDPDDYEGTYDGYPDIVTNGWYSDAVEVLSKLEVIKGDTDGTYRPGDPISRAEFASMVQLFYELDDGDATKMPFTDVGTSHWAKTAIAAAYEADIVVGTNDEGTLFEPNEDISRAQAVTMLNKAQGRFTNAEMWDGVEIPFTDVTTDHWGWTQVMEAAVEHEHPATTATDDTDADADEDTDADADTEADAEE